MVSAYNNLPINASNLSAIPAMHTVGSTHISARLANGKKWQMLINQQVEHIDPRILFLFFFRRTVRKVIHMRLTGCSCLMA